MENHTSAPTSPLKPLPALPMMLSPSQSAPDIISSVANLVTRFNTLEVTDRAEEAVARQLRKLESCLRRAEVAREEAESEVRGLRKDVKALKNEVKELVEVGEDWVEEKKALKGRSDEYEKKYEKAKAHFRTQRTKHEEVTRKAAKEFMEREKQHWRVQAALEEELEWERKMRADAIELVAFCEIERQIALRCACKRMNQKIEEIREEKLARADSAVDHKMEDDVSFTMQEEEAPQVEDEEKIIDDAPEDMVEQQEDMQTNEEVTHQEDSPTNEQVTHQDSPPQSPHSRQEHYATDTTTFAHHETAETDQTPALEFTQHEDDDDAREETPAEEAETHQDDFLDQPTPSLLPSVFDDKTPEPESELGPLSPPKKKTLTVPINFGDDEDEEEPTSPNSDKENSAPPRTFSSSTPAPFSTPARPASAHSVLHKTPATISTSTFGRSWTKEAREERGGSVDRGAHDWNIPGVVDSADLDRTAALAAIRERRGRARSFMTGGASGTALTTPGKKAASEDRDDGPKTPKRDVSAPVKLATMSVGRAAGRGGVR